MPRTVPPERWEELVRLINGGHSITAAGRQAGISKNAVTKFLKRDPSSSGVRWTYEIVEEAARALRILEQTGELEEVDPPPRGVARIPVMSRPNRTRRASNR